MWELIEANKRKSLILIFCLFLLLIALGAVIGGVCATYTVDYGQTVTDADIFKYAIKGAMGGTFLALILFLLAYFTGDSLLLGSLGAKEVTHDIHPTLFNVVEEMRIAAGLSFSPKIYILDAPWPNAFATGVRQNKASIAVTVGLLARLNRDELQGVVAHEMSHILNRDVLFMTLAATMLGSIQILADSFLRTMRFGGNSRSRYRSGSGSGGGGAAILILAAILLSVLGMIFARLFYFAISRKREYLADASGVRLTRYPEGLASALEKISGDRTKPTDINQFASASFIMNPLDANEEGAFADLTSTHPPIHQRINILRSMSFGASFQDYAKAFASVRKDTSGLLPPSALNEKTIVPIRTASIELPKAEAPKDIARDMGDLIAATHGFAFFKCMCGLRFKIPPNYQEKTIPCPRCGMMNTIPFSGPIGQTQVQTGPAEEAGNGTTAAETLQVYKRKGGGWESFFCSCGKMVQLAPTFSLGQIKCPFCKKQIKID